MGRSRSPLDMRLEDDIDRFRVPLALPPGLWNTDPHSLIGPARHWRTWTPRDDPHCMALHVLCDLAAPRLQLSDERLCTVRQVVGSTNPQLAAAMVNLTVHGRAALLGSALGSPSGDLWITPERLRHVFARLLLALAGRSIEAAVSRIKYPGGHEPWVADMIGSPQQSHRLRDLNMEIRRCFILLRDALAEDSGHRRSAPTTFTWDGHDGRGEDRTDEQVVPREVIEMFLFGLDNGITAVRAYDGTRVSHLRQRASEITGIPAHQLNLRTPAGTIGPTEVDVELRAAGITDGCNVYVAREPARDVRPIGNLPDGL